MLSVMNRNKVILSVSCVVFSALSISNVYADLPQPYKQVCIGLGGNNLLTQNQQNFTDICNDIVGQSDSEDNEAIAALRHEEVATQGNASLESSKKHTNNVKLRVNQLHQVKRGGGSGDDNNELLESSRWGFFANVGHNKGDRTQTIDVVGTGQLGDANQAIVQGERAFDFDGNELSVGLDYRLPGEKFIVGSAFGYSQSDSKFTTQAGNTELKGQHISAFATYLPTDNLYVDGIVSIGKNSIDASRPVPVYDNRTGTVLAADGRAFANTDSQVFSISVGMGYEFNRNAWSISPYTRLDYTKTDIDNYTETVLDNDPLGRDSSGMVLSVKDQSATSLLGIIGIRANYPISTSNGVFVPQTFLELNHQFKNDERFIDATLPVAANLNIDNPSMQTSRLDQTYLKLGVGISAIFPKGHSGFIQIETLQGSDDLSDTAIKAGYRLEF